MQKRKSFFPVFLIFFILSVLFFTLSRAGVLNGITEFFETATVPFQQMVFGTIHNRDEEITNLREVNLELASKLSKQKDQNSEIKALRDQFQTSNPASRTLLPAIVIGGSGDSIIIDKGQIDNVKKGDVVIIKDNLIGKIDKASQHQSAVNVISAGMSFTAKTLKTGSVGIVKSQGGKLILDNVVLSDRLEKDDLVLTKGSVDEKGLGFPPDLIVGKVVSVNKKASSLFQIAEVVSLVDFEKLSTVFVIIRGQ